MGISGLLLHNEYMTSVTSTIPSLAHKPGTFNGWYFQWLVLSMAGTFNGWYFPRLVLSTAGTFNGWYFPVTAYFTALHTNYYELMFLSSFIFKLFYFFKFNLKISLGEKDYLKSKTFTKLFRSLNFHSALKLEWSWSSPSIKQSASSLVSSLREEQ